MVVACVLAPWVLACSSVPATSDPKDAEAPSGDAGLSDAWSPGPDGGAPDAGVQSYSPYDSRVRYIGRIDMSDPAGPWITQSATTVTVAFRGSTAAVQINDQTSYSGESDFIDVILDGNIPFVVITPSGATWVSLLAPDDAGVPVPLASGDHTVTLVKRTEATVGKVQLLGFHFEEILSPSSVSTPIHRIEIIGDSIACAYGVALAKL